jgi:hypothetical protein
MGLPEDVVGEYYMMYINTIFSKIAALQPSLFITDYELSEFIYDPRLFADIEWPFAEETNIEYLEKLNHIRSNLGDCKDAYSQFLTDSYFSIKKKLLNDELVSECLNCGDLFLYVDSKKYCSGKCRKQAESKRYYRKHGDKLKDVKREEMRTTRSYYKQMGVKK